MNRKYLLSLTDDKDFALRDIILSMSEAKINRIYDWIKELENNTKEKFHISKINIIDGSQFTVSIGTTVLFGG
jgi:hypothetical protein